MDALLLQRIETNSVRASAALFGCAVGAATWAVSQTVGLKPALASACAAGLAAFWLCCWALDALQLTEPHFRLAAFEPVEFESIEFDELLLTELDRVKPAELLLTESDRLEPKELVLGEADRLHPAEPLVLDDILASIGPEARVVRLFDRKAMPTPGELRAAIDDRLSQESEPAAPDASQALSNALAELRRSLR